MSRGPRMMTREDVARAVDDSRAAAWRRDQKQAKRLQQERDFLARRAARRDRLRSISAWLKRGG